MQHKYFKIILVLFLGFLLRFHQYEYFPVFGETKDELAWTWMGSSILQGKHPTSWSATGETGYMESRITHINDEKYQIVTPYLDNPHLFSLIPGAAALIGGYSGIEIPSIKVIRLPMILLGTLNILLLYLAAKKLFNRRTALLASLLYATIPTFVFSSRYVMAENLLTTFMLSSMWLLAHTQKKIPRKINIYLGILSGLSLLTKVSGLVVLAANSLTTFKIKGSKPAKKILLIGLLVGSLYPIYGLLTGPELFVRIVSTQSNFSIGFSQFISLFMFPQFAEKTIVDGWRYLGLFSLLWMVLSDARSKTNTIIQTYAILWFGFLLTATNEVGSHGWYMYPLFPLMSIGIAKLLLEKYKQPFTITLLYLMAILPTLSLFLSAQNIQIQTTLMRIIMAIGFLPLFLFSIKKSINMKKFLSLSLLIALVLNIATIVSFNNIRYWEDSLHYYPIRSGE